MPLQQLLLSGSGPICEYLLRDELIIGSAKLYKLVPEGLTYDNILDACSCIGQSHALQERLDLITALTGRRVSQIPFLCYTYLM